MAGLTQGEVEAYAARGVSLRIASRSDVGLVRPNNEDTVLLGDLASGRQGLTSGRVGPAGVLFGVCDGMGGAAGGEVASRLAADVVLRELARSSVAAGADGFADAVSGAVAEAGRAIREHVRINPELAGMGTTCTVAALRGVLLVVAHVGDSRAYLLRAGRLRQLTRDQTWANEMLARGRVSAEEAAVMENGRAITQAVGTNEGLEVELVKLALCQGDRVLICSDGLSGMVSDSTIAEVVTEAEDLEAACDELLRNALAGGGRDNVSFVLCEFSGKALGALALLEPEYQLPLNGSRRAAAALITAMVVIACVLWRLSIGVVDHGAAERAAHAARPMEVRAPAVSAPRPEALMAAERGADVVEVSPPAGGEAGKEVSQPARQQPVPRKRQSSSAIRPIRSGLRPQPPVTIERPVDEEIRIIRDDGPAAGQSF